MHIITHRGLDPSYPHYYQESSFQAFKDQLVRGYGLEFDVRITKDKQLVVIHDETLARFSQNRDMRNISEVSLKELLAMTFNNCRLVSLVELLAMITKHQSSNTISAIHIKHACQNTETLDILLEELALADTSTFILFDVTKETATYLKNKNKELILAPSISHPYDIERYNVAVGGTLMKLEDALANKDLFSWVWLDEWDRTDKNGGSKSLYNEETFEMLRKAGLKIALVTPELHATSPHLLGGESHPDAKDAETLHRRFKEIVALKPDAVCTDYPDLLKELAYK